ncbi:MAG: PorT family protein [Bacteroidetes bacterium]|nr:PorT family protein [Bacteroidota bacterium]MBS1757821.1 PorT family protein [Bacteroidota bacterium]
MKKFFTLIILSFAAAFAYAQTNVGFGIKAGLSSSGIKGDASSSLSNLLDYTKGMVTTKNRTGYFAGAYANIPVSKNIQVEPGIYYTQKGYEMDGELNIKGLSFLGANAKAQLQSQYLDMPLLLKVSLDGLQLFAGPQFSYLLNSKLHTTAGALGINFVNSYVDATSQFNKWDASVTAGIGYNITKQINISASYDYGLSKIDANKSLSAYNRGFKAGVAISF